jgi:hypothetical protein
LEVLALFRGTDDIFTHASRELHRENAVRGHWVQRDANSSAVVGHSSEFENGRAHFIEKREINEICLRTN